jgi:hypothetical protein
MPSLGLTQEQTPEDQAPAAKQVLPASALDLAEIIPLAATLSSRLAALEKKVTGLVDISEVKKTLAFIPGYFGWVFSFCFHYHYGNLG